MAEEKKKKPYSKPDIIFESFELQTSIAASCEVDANSGQYMCGGIELPGASNVFLTGVSGCFNGFQWKMWQGTTYMGVNVPCYETPTESYNVFGS